MRKNLPVLPHRRAGFAGAAALFPANGTIEISTPGHVSGIQVGLGTAGVHRRISHEEKLERGYGFRATSQLAACAIGRMTISSMSTYGGRVTAKTMQSAMSAATRGFTPL